MRASSVRSWRQHLRDYLGGIAGRPIADMTSADIQAAVMPLWATKHKTAQKLLRRIGNVMQWATTHGLRTDDPVPAVARTLPKVKAAPNHYRALPHGEVAGVLARVRTSGARRAVANLPAQPPVAALARRTPLTPLVLEYVDEAIGTCAQSGPTPYRPR